MKIQINNLAALERLIGGDSELEMEIRRSVAEDFSKKYLKSLVTEYTDKGLTARVRELVIERVRYTDYLSEEYRELIKEQVDKKVKQLIQERVQAFVDKERELRRMVEVQVEESIQRHLSTIDNKTIEAKAKKLIQEKFK